MALPNGTAWSDETNLQNLGRDRAEACRGTQWVRSVFGKGCVDHYHVDTSLFDHSLSSSMPGL